MDRFYIDFRRACKTKEQADNGGHGRREVLGA